MIPAIAQKTPQKLTSISLTVAKATPTHIGRRDNFNLNGEKRQTCGNSEIQADKYRGRYEYYLPVASYLLCSGTLNATNWMTTIAGVVNTFIN